MLIVSHDVAADIAGTQTGHLIPWALERGVTLRTADAVVDPELPRRRCDGEFVAVLGSAQAAYDETKPWIAREREWIRGLHAAGTAILGVCFGGQQLSRALGGTVSRGPYSEFGWTDIEPSPATTAWSAPGRGSPSTTTSSPSRTAPTSWPEARCARRPFAPAARWASSSTPNSPRRCCRAGSTSGRRS